MPAIAITSDGKYIYLALENLSGVPIIVRCQQDDLATFEAAYQPGAGSAANVRQVPSNPNRMLFYGNFGSNVEVIEHTPSSGVNSDISPPSLGSNVVNGLDVNPNNENEILITVNGSQDLLRTTDKGDNWTTLNSNLGINPTAIAVVWPDSLKLFIAGNTGSETRLLWSTDRGSSFTNQAGSALGAAANITNVELVAP